MGGDLSKILELRAELKRHNSLYYSGNPEISDYKFDMMMNELKKLEEEHPEMYDENSPTQVVGN